MTRAYRLGKRGETAAASRQRILDVATELMVAADAPTVSVDEIAAAANVSRPTVYRCFGSKVGLLEAVAWNTLSSVGLDRIDDARQLPDAMDALRTFIRENCRMLSEVGDGLRAAVRIARHQPEVAEVIEATYYGRRVESLRHLSRRLADAHMLAPGWTIEGTVDALMVLTSVDTFESLNQQRNRTWRQAANRLFDMTGSFTTRP
jgi:AcrR family transcriptional regulator